MARWAVLIGINFYVGGRCLAGSVRDVMIARQYLEAGSDPVDMMFFTATKPSGSTCRVPPEDPGFWPTSANVTQALKRILSNAKRGDLVYLHYSGHGTRRPGDAPHRGNLALVLFEDNDHGMSYYDGRLLARCLRAMVDQGLLVTVVLDCCFSGSVLRSDNIRGTDVRALDYSPAVDAASPADLLVDAFDATLSFRDARAPLDQWLVNPDGYTILAACGPHEIARELELDTGERRGALSYFLVDALGDLRKRGTDVTHESLYEHLRVRFRASWPLQTPMRYGNGSVSFFEALGVASDTPFVRIFRVDDRLCLDAGEAHGVHIGDEYASYPFDFSEDAAVCSATPSVMVRVDTVRGLTSDLVGIEPTTCIQRLQTGWKARLVTSLPFRKTAVRIVASACDHIQPTGDPQQRWLRIFTGSDAIACAFNITVNDRMEYEILDASLQRIRSLPTIPTNAREADNRIMDVLQHVAQFKCFEGIENRLPNSSFEAGFSLSSWTESGVPAASGIIEIDHRSRWHLVTKNNSETALYLAIFNLAPSWKVSNILSDAGDNAFRVIQPKHSEELQLEMEVPDFLRRQGETQCEEVVKVFITSKPSSFQAVILNDIHNIDHHRGGANGGDSLSTFLVDLVRPFRDQNVLRQESWATRNFIIRTTLRENAGAKQ